MVELHFLIYWKPKPIRDKSLIIFLENMKGIQIMLHRNVTTFV